MPVDVDYQKSITVDNLGPKTSKNYAKGQKVLAEARKYIKPGVFDELSTETETTQVTRSHTDQLLKGDLRPGKTANFPERPNLGKNTAFTRGMLAASFGENHKFSKQVNAAPEELKKGKDYQTIVNCSSEVEEAEENCQTAYGEKMRYNKG